MSSDGGARAESGRARLARLGAHDPQAAAGRLGHPLLAPLGAAAVDDLALAPDPDLVLASLTAAGERAQRDARAQLRRFVAELDRDAQLRRRAYLVLGLSAPLGEHLARHPDDWPLLRAAPAPTADALRAELLTAVGADPQQPVPIADGGGDHAVRLRAAYHRRLLALSADDLSGAVDLPGTATALSDLADAALEAALAAARAEHPDDARTVRLAVVAMGKCGGRELNYVSDVDVLFVAEPCPDVPDDAALGAATRLARAAMRLCGTPNVEGTLWTVDANLRPEGRDGALVRTLGSYEQYYRRWARTWEFQALLKARPAAGDRELGERFVAMTAPLVWSAADRDGFVEHVQEMRRRVESAVPPGERDRQLKLGPGGLRDVEFSVQLLQLVHGRADPALRSPTTLTALAELSAGGYVGRSDAAELHDAYLFLRTLEHRLQQHRLRRTHVVPAAASTLRRVARAMGYRSDPVAELTADWRRHQGQVRRLHEKLFYRPLLEAVARLDAGSARLTHHAAEQRLRALGYVDPAGALRHLDALTAGVSRRAAIQRTLLPVLLGWFAESPDPDGGLQGFRRVSDALGTTPWYLRLLRDDSTVAQRMAHVLASSRFATDLLLRAPEAVAMLGDDAELAPRDRDGLVAEAQAAARRHDDPELAAAAVRGLRRRELFRTAVAELTGTASVEQAAGALSAITDATIAGALLAATRSVAGDGVLPTRFAVIAMGRYGGAELGFGSDADVMFVHDPLPGADDAVAGAAALAVARELRRLLALPAPDPPLEIDADLRPEGRSGPLVRSLASYRAYYARWSEPWEAQALLRAAPVAGDEELGARFVSLVDPLRYPAGGLDEAALRHIRRLKARMEAERLPRGADPWLHTKLGRGGLTDVEWVAQLLALRHGYAVPGLRTTRTLPALAAAADAGLLAAPDAERLAQAWRSASGIRDAVMLVRGRPSDLVPTEALLLAQVSQVLGYAPGRAGDLLEDYRRVARRARDVVERVFYA